MSNPKFQIQKFTRQHKRKLKEKKNTIQKSMILNIKQNINNQSSFIFRLNRTLELDKEEHKIGLKYISYPSSKENKLNYIFVYIDIIDNDFNNSSLLKIIKPQYTREVIYDNPEYFNINNSYINTVKVTLLDENNKFIKFEKGLVILDLEKIKK